MDELDFLKSGLKFVHVLLGCVGSKDGAQRQARYVSDEYDLEEPVEGHAEHSRYQERFRHGCQALGPPAAAEFMGWTARPQ